MTNFAYNVFIFSSKSYVYSSKVFNKDLMELDYKKVVTLKTDLDNLILGSFSNNTSSIDE